MARFHFHLDGAPSRAMDYASLEEARDAALHQLTEAARADPVRFWDERLLG